MPIRFKYFVTVNACSFTALVLIYLGLMQCPVFAQVAAQEQRISSDKSGGAVNGASTTGNGATNASTNAAILAELERMRARIQELEAQLKAQSAASQVEHFSASAAEQPEAVQPTAGKQEPAKAEKQKPADPFAFADFTWLNGTARTKTPAMDTPFFTPEIRADVNYIYSFNHPSNNTIGGSS